MLVATDPRQREKLVRLANETAERLGPALTDRSAGDKKIGLTQLRALADACHRAVVEAEIEAFLAYQEGRGIKETKRGKKDRGPRDLRGERPDQHGEIEREGWAALVAVRSPDGRGVQERSAADVVLEAMRRAVDHLPADAHRERLDTLALFFGYLYRAAVAVTAGQKEGAR
ncbi:hypothetical protein [Symbiobacterium thermophilum]|uniref:Uncharacterized protein n=1 Tax=Symbiobacterium thermophilum TaxID=2734 RepID=A0A953I9R3_SYMTR|nr:hypothetical protein [Symbiobacterium thermophilum]MBY6277023.1 hypothetical protein [Symbiobacterium thermophilum]